MPRQLRFLGLTLTETATSGHFAPPQSLPAQVSIPNPSTSWSVVLDNATQLLTAKLVVDFGSATRVSLYLKLATVTAGNIVTLVDGQHNASNLPDAYCNIVSPVPGDFQINAGLDLRCGPLHLTAQPGPGWVRSQNGKLMISVLNLTEFVMDDALPVQLRVTPDLDAGFVSPDLALCQAEVLANGILLQTSTPTIDPTDGSSWRGQMLQHPNESATIDLLKPLSAASMFFTADTTPLPLHVEPGTRNAAVSASNQLAVPMRAKNHRLRLLLSRPAGAISQTTVMEIALHPAAGAALTLTTPALAGTNNQPIDWAIGGLTNSGLKLRMRIPDASRCGTLLLDQSANKIADATRRNAGPLHSELLDAIVLAGAAADLRCEVMTPHQQNDASGAVYPGRAYFDESTLAEGTAPHLLWQAAGAVSPPGFNHARTGASYRTNQTASNVVDVLKFQGAALAMPLLPLAKVVAPSVGAANTQTFRANLDSVIKGHAASPTAVTHETQRQELPDPTPIGIASAFLPASGLQPDLLGNTFALAALTVSHDYGQQVLQVAGGLPPRVQRPTGADPDFIILGDSYSVGGTVIPAGTTIIPPSIPVAINYSGIVLSGAFNANPDFPDMPRAVLKFTRTRKLADIVTQAGNDAFRKGFAAVLPKLPDQMLREDWTGVVFFDVGVAFTDELLKAVIPSVVASELRFGFVAISPRLRGLAATAYRPMFPGPIRRHRIPRCRGRPRRVRQTIRPRPPFRSPHLKATGIIPRCGRW